jgi:signal transduction histidine kinase
MRVVDIINEMRGLSRDLGQMEEVDINYVVMESIEILRNMLDKNKTTLIEKYEHKLPTIKANSTELIQIISNIIRNAIQAMGIGGTITISTSKSEFMNKDRINVRIMDTGPGISPENLPRIFESGFTTKSKQDGTGLGLSICKKLARKYGGDVYVEKTTVGKGTSFVVYFPIIIKEVSKQTQETQQETDSLQI